MTNNPHDFDHRPPTTAELVINFVKYRFWSIIVVAAGVGAIATFAGLDPTVPRWIKLMCVTALVLSPAGYFVGSYIVNLLWSPNYIFLLDLDARKTDGALYRFPFQQFQKLETTTGSLDELTPNLYIGKNVDLEELTVEGTWRGTLSDRELLTALHKVDQCYGQLREDAKEGFAWKNNAFMICYNAIRSGVRHVVETFESGTLPDEGEGLGNAVDDALDRYDLEEEIEDLAEDTNLDPAAAEGGPDDDLDRDRADDVDQPQEVPADD
jgi:hypothetical protein